MPNEQNKPKEYDAVLGGQNLIPRDAAVLGGVAGVKSRLSVPCVEVRIAALSDALKYGDAGLDLIIEALRDESMQVKFTAYSLLKYRDDLKIKAQLQEYLSTFELEFDVITVDKDGKENSRRKSKAFYFCEDLGKSVVLDIVYIPGGTFMMGRPDSEVGNAVNESPQHQVTVPAFFAGKYPITQEQWQALMGKGNNPSSFKGEKLPVENVSWYQAVEFCNKLSEKSGKKYRLLSEAEWEYACRAGTTTPFHFGETITPDLVNYDGNFPYANALKGLYRRGTTDVGSFPPNAFGLYDMHGNVREWCSDEWYPSYNSHNGAPTDGSSWEIGVTTDRVLRGGTWHYNGYFCRSANRDWNGASRQDRNLAFRVAMALVSAPS